MWTPHALNEMEALFAALEQDTSTHHATHLGEVLGSILQVLGDQACALQFRNSTKTASEEGLIFTQWSSLEARFAGSAKIQAEGIAGCCCL